jgi:hypothetical protein
MTLTILDPRTGQHVTVTAPDILAVRRQEVMMKRSSQRQARRWFLQTLGTAI